MSRKGPKNPERAFGVSVGTVLMLIAVYAWWRDRTMAAAIFGAVGAVLYVLGRVRPDLLAWPSAIWWKFAMVLGYINARIILTLAFALVFVPIGMAWRVLGRDPLRTNRSSWPGWTPYPPRYRDHTHFSRMY